MPILPLNSSVVNKIAAGEVIERPASVVKELLENAVDSGASRIELHLEQGGRQLIRVTDNGCGIAVDELQLAVTNHATSKIATADDLFSVATMGFRGEALASISEVSRTMLRSRTAGSESGAEMLVTGGQVHAPQPAGCPIGTTVEVRDLFFNTPVRERFLKTPQTEVGHATEAFTRLALANPPIHMRMTHGGREVFDLAPTTDWHERIAMLFGDELASGLIEVASVDGQVKLRGYVANPMHSRANGRLQYLLLNGRTIRDRSLQHALGEAYRGLLLTGRFPICFLRIDMPPNMVDVNVHPTKLEVRFQDGGRLYSQLLSTLRSKFLATDLRATARSDSPVADENEAAAATPTTPSEIVRWAQRELANQRVDGPSDSIGPPHRATGEPLVLHELPADFRERRMAEQLANGEARPPMSPPTSPAASTAASAKPDAITDSFKAIQLHNRYLIVESSAGLEIIDQHALHERILYEQIRHKLEGAGLESQRLLVPEPVDLSTTECQALLEQRDVLAKLGIEIDAFGGDTVLVRSYPSMLANLPPADVVTSIASQLATSEQSPSSVELVDELLHSISCKAAVKYGDRLAPGEVQALLAERHLTQNHHHCPHGRPTALVFSCDDLDKQFQRQ